MQNSVSSKASENICKGPFAPSQCPALLEMAVMKDDLYAVKNILYHYHPTPSEMIKWGKFASPHMLEMVLKTMGASCPDYLAGSLARSDASFPGRLKKIMPFINVPHAAMTLIRTRLQSFLSADRETRAALERMFFEGHAQGLPFSCAMHQALSGKTILLKEYLKNNPHDVAICLTVAVFFSRLKLTKFLKDFCRPQDMEDAFEVCIRINQTKIFHILLPCLEPVLFKHKFLLSALLLRREAMSKKLICFVKRESIMSGIDVWHDKTAERLKRDFLVIESEVVRHNMMNVLAEKTHGESPVLRKM